MCVFACERLRLQHVYSIWLNYSEFVSMPYEEHKLQHSLWIIMKHNTLSLALTFGNNHSNFIIECTKICFYWTCLCAPKSLSLSHAHSIFHFYCLRWQNSFKLFSHWIKHGNPIVIYARKRECVITRIPVFIVFGMWSFHKWKIGFCSVWGCLGSFWIRPLIDI